MTNVTIENVSDTAFWVAHYRGIEGKQKSPLFEDPLAAVLAGERGRRIAESMPRPFITAWVISVRTRLIDDLIRGCLARGVDTVLNLGAGLDTRAYRMDLPSTLQWIEADYPAMIEYKERLLAKETPRFQLTRVKCDLANDAERRALLANANAKSGKMLVLTEGVIPYLTNDQVGTLADDLRVLDHAADHGDQGPEVVVIGLVAAIGQDAMHGHRVVEGLQAGEPGSGTALHPHG